MLSCHFYYDRSRVQTVLGDNQSSTESHFIAYGPLKPSNHSSLTDSPAVFFVGSNKKSILRKLEFETDQPTRVVTDEEQIPPLNNSSTVKVC
jgi:hypothetical protein